MVCFVDLKWLFWELWDGLRGIFCVVKSLISLYWSLGRGPMGLSVGPVLPHYMTPVPVTLIFLRHHG